MTDEILSEREIEMYIGSWRLIPASHGVFDVTVNGDLVFSKDGVDRHAEPGEIRTLIIAKLDEVYPNRPPYIPEAEE